MHRRHRSSLDAAATATRTGSAATTPPLPLRTVLQPAGGTGSAELSAGTAQSTIVDSVPKPIVSGDVDATVGLAAVLVTDAGLASAAAVEDTLVVDDDDEDSEEEPEALLAAGEDIFSKLMTASQAHCYPLPQPKKTPASASSAPPTDDFLRSYVMAHCKSFRLTEALLDCYFSALQAQLVALAISESLQKADLYAALQADANQLASHLVRFGLPLLGRLLAVDPSFLPANLLSLSFGGVERGRVYSDARQVVRKARLLHCLFAALDIFVFPRSVPAHTAGCKGISHAYTDPQFVCTAGYDRAVRIWDLRVGSAGSGGSGGGTEGTGGAKCLAQFMGHTSVVTWCAFAAGDGWLVSGSLDGTVRVWESRTGVCTRVLAGHADGVLCGELGAKDKYVATGSLDCTVRLWSPHTGKCLRVYRGHRHWVKCVRFAPEAQALISTGLDNAIFVWHMRGGAGGGGTGAGGGAASAADNSGALGAPRHVLLAHSAPVMDVRLLSGGGGGGGAHFVSASKDLTLRVWDLRQGKEVGQLANPARSTPVALALSPDGKALACAFFDHTINVYEMDASSSSSSAAAAALPSGAADRNGSSGGSNASGGNAVPSSAHARGVSGVDASSSSSVNNSSSSNVSGGAGAGLSPIDGFKLRRQIKVHNDGLICVSWCSRTTLLVGTATGQLQILQI
jgi:WD40 repeat protein